MCHDCLVDWNDPNPEGEGVSQFFPKTRTPANLEGLPVMVLC
jgi:hypothetical protein